MLEENNKPFRRMNHLKISLFFTIFILAGIRSASGQSYQKDTAAIRELVAQTERYKKAFLQDDVETAIAMTHPELIEKMGGVDNMRESFLKGKAMREEYKMQYTDLTYTVPDAVLIHDKNIQVAFPMEITVQYEDNTTSKDRRIMIASFDAAASAWHFLSFPPKDKGKMKAALQYLDAGLVIPD